MRAGQVEAGCGGVRGGGNGSSGRTSELPAVLRLSPRTARVLVHLAILNTISPSTTPSMSTPPRTARILVLLALLIKMSPSTTPSMSTPPLSSYCPSTCSPSITYHNVTLDNSKYEYSASLLVLPEYLFS
ncbi:hypothetical protein J6590_027707 [Homalodisca vitripennis]|nr:hypothetical protein J6590_027707 [Homalodisca vitripennis]